jgi:hypothetical protein
MYGCKIISRNVPPWITRITIAYWRAVIINGSDVSQNYDTPPALAYNKSVSRDGYTVAAGNLRQFAYRVSWLFWSRCRQAMFTTKTLGNFLLQFAWRRYVTCCLDTVES